MRRFAEAFAAHPLFLLEGAIGERLKREHGVAFDENAAMAGLVRDAAARDAMAALWTEYMRIARRLGYPFVALTPTRRANRERLPLSAFSDDIFRENVDFLRELAAAARLESYVGGTMGCKGDAYLAADTLSATDAEDFHSFAAERFADAGADFLFASLMPAVAETVGLAKACERTRLPYIVSFMLRDNGRLADGAPLHDAIAAVDDATADGPLCYMANCVHPANLLRALAHPFNRTDLVRRRFRGLQANASPLSPEELDGCAQLVTSEPRDLAEGFRSLRGCMDFKIAGGCCGTDGGHLWAIAEAMLPGQTHG